MALVGQTANPYGVPDEKVGHMLLKRLPVRYPVRKAAAKTVLRLVLFIYLIIIANFFRQYNENEVKFSFSDNFF